MVVTQWTSVGKSHVFSAHFSGWAWSQWTAGCRRWSTCRKWRRISASRWSGGEETKNVERLFFFGKGRKHRNAIALISAELAVFYRLTTHIVFQTGTTSYDAFISLNPKKKCGVSHAPRRTGLLQTQPHRVWFLRCRRRWVSAQPWTEHCNTQIHSKCSSLYWNYSISPWLHKSTNRKWYKSLSYQEIINMNH